MEVLELENAESVPSVRLCLDQWSVLEPERCCFEKIYFHGAEAGFEMRYAFPRIGPFASIDVASLNGNTLGRSDAMIIQAAVQEAIAHKEWDWTLVKYESSYTAFIHWPEGPVIRVESPEPEMALLRCYLALLGAQR